MPNGIDFVRVFRRTFSFEVPGYLSGKEKGKLWFQSPIREGAIHYISVLPAGDRVDDLLAAIRSVHAVDSQYQKLALMERGEFADLGYKCFFVIAAVSMPPESPPILDFSCVYVSPDQALNIRILGRLDGGLFRDIAMRVSKSIRSEWR